MKEYKHSRKEIARRMHIGNIYSFERFKKFLLAAKKPKKRTDHDMDCATNASEVADEFAVMGCTCGFEAFKKSKEKCECEKLGEIKLGCPVHGLEPYQSAPSKPRTEPIKTVAGMSDESRYIIKEINDRLNIIKDL